MPELRGSALATGGRPLSHWGLVRSGRQAGIKSTARPTLAGKGLFCSSSEAAVRSPPRLRASLGRVVLMHPATRVGGPCSVGFRAFFSARKSCVLMRDDANRCVDARSCDPPHLPAKTNRFHALMLRAGGGRAAFGGPILLCGSMHLGYAVSASLLLHSLLRGEDVAFLHRITQFARATSATASGLQPNSEALYAHVRIL